MIMKTTAYVLESLRSVVFLCIGLFVLGMVESPLTKNMSLNVPMLLLLFGADLLILYVVHRNFLGHKRFYRAAQQPKLSGLKTWGMLSIALLTIIALSVLT